MGVPHAVLAHQLLGNPLSQPLTRTGTNEPTLVSLFGRLPRPGGPAAQNALPDREYLGSDTASELQDRFDSIVYQSQVQQVAVSVRLQEVAAQLAQGEEGTTGQVEARQLTFDFFAECRTEQLAQFQRQTNAVADNLEGVRQETLVQASQRVAARFSLSVNVSGSLLDGFAGGAEKVQNADDEPFAEFFSFANDMLGKADEVINQIFDLLDGFFKSSDSLDKLSDIMNELLRIFGAQEGIPVPTSDSGQGQSRIVQMEFSFELSIEVTVAQGEVQTSDPVTFDLDGDGVELTNYRNGARFDILGNGRRVNTAFVTGGDAFLALDRNGNGIIDSGRELFGDQNGAQNGFEELRKLDSNRDGVINARDQRYEDLVLWRDNGDGRTEPGELVSLPQAAVVEINLRYGDVNLRAAGGNRIGQVASFQWADGAKGRVSDTILNYTA